MKKKKKEAKLQHPSSGGLVEMFNLFLRYSECIYLFVVFMFHSLTTMKSMNDGHSKTV